MIATGKHFPGLGYAKSNTDNEPTTVRATGPQLAADLLPYRRAIAGGLKMVLVSTAVYPALGDELPAACSTRVVTDLLRQELGFRGVVITDDLQTPGVNHFLTTTEAGVKAIGAGVDMVLAAGLPGEADRTSKNVYRALVVAAKRGTLSLGAWPRRMRTCWSSSERCVEPHSASVEYAVKDSRVQLRSAAPGGGSG